MSKVLAALIWFCFPVVAGTVVFAAAGRLDLPMVWAILGVLTVFGVLLVTLGDSTMLRERHSPGAGNRDRLTQPLSLVLLLGHWILGGLDVGRFEWSLVPLSLQIAGLVGYAGSLAVLIWAMRVNRFYSSVVRVQTDRGHHPIMTGPYALVRHPGYTASMIGALCGGLALGSWLALVPILIFVGLFIRRTVVEDNMLRQELPGYAEYAQKVRYRLITGIF